MMMADLGIRLDITSLYNNIKPGDTTHEDTRSKFNEYFQKFSRRMKTYVHSSSHNEGIIQLLPCFVLQVAYDYCQQFILMGPLMNNFRENMKNYIIPDEIKQLNIYKTSAVNSRTRHDETFDKLFKVNSVKEGETFELLKAGYGAFLHISQAKSHQSFDTLINETLNALPANIRLPEERIKEMITEAVDVAWNILTLVPPALLDQPTKYKEAWHDKRITSWNKESTSEDPVVYFKPVLFYSALGHVGSKGAIGNTQSSKNMEILECQYCPIRSYVENDVSTDKHAKEETEQVTRTQNTPGSKEKLYCTNNTVKDQIHTDISDRRGNNEGPCNNQLEGRICSTSTDEEYIKTLSQIIPDDHSYNISTEEGQRLSRFMESYGQSQEEKQQDIQTSISNDQLKGRICSTSIDEEYIKTYSQSIPDDHRYNIPIENQQELSLFLESYSQPQGQKEKQEDTISSPHTTTSKETISHDNHVTTHKNHVTTRDDHLTTRDDHLTTRDDLLTTRDDHLTTRDDHLTTRDDLLTTLDGYLITTQEEDKTSNNNSLHSETSTTNSPPNMEIVSITSNGSHDNHHDDKDKERSNHMILSEVTNLCHDIKPGDMTHEKICVSFNEYFATFNRRAKVFVRYRNILQQLPCAVLQVAYDQCVEYMLRGPVMTSFLTSKEYDQLPETIKEWFIKEEISDLPNVSGIFKSGVNLENKEKEWTTLKTSYSYLLHLSKAKTLQPFTELNNKVKSILPHWDGHCFNEMIEKAVQLGWNMITLVPPFLLCQPLEHDEELHERRPAYWSDFINNDFIYFQPVLLYSALGHVASQGVIGNVRTDRMEILRVPIERLVIEIDCETKSVLSIEEISLAEQTNGVISIDEHNSHTFIDEHTNTGPVLELYSDSPFINEYHSNTTGASSIDSISSNSSNEYYTGEGNMNGESGTTVVVTSSNIGANDNTSIKNEYTTRRHIPYHEFDIIWSPCPNCGSEEMRPHNSSICQQCINNLPASRQSNVSHGPAPDWISLSILTLMCCFCPISVIALIKSLQTKEYNRKRQYIKATETSKKAKQYNMLSIIFGSIIILTSLIVIFSSLIYIASSL